MTTELAALRERLADLGGIAGWSALDALARDAIALAERQQAEIERMRKAIEAFAYPSRGRFYATFMGDTDVTEIVAAILAAGEKP